ncbi:MAG: hypothetical protein V7744_11730 [Pseudomonadales bacterium]
MSSVFDDELLADYMSDFWGYGNPQGRYWFVGMEEGGGDSYDDIARRISQWDKRGRNSLEDIYEYHMDIQVPKWFKKGAPLQSTWNKLIRVLLAAKGEEPEREAVRAYQIDRLARADDEVCLLELLPLPSPSTTHWLYSQHSTIPELRSREEYTRVVGEYRATKINEMITKQQPAFVMFYGMSYLDWWKKVAGVDLVKHDFQDKAAYFGEIGGTKLAVTQHPVATGVTLEYFHSVGRYLRG